VRVLLDYEAMAGGIVGREKQIGEYTRSYLMYRYSLNPMVLVLYLKNPANKEKCAAYMPGRNT